jgi:hypothetical protein
VSDALLIVVLVAGMLAAAVAVGLALRHRRRSRPSARASLWPRARQPGDDG